MTVAVSKAGPYYSSGEIKFSDLRRDFRAQVRKSSSGGSETFNTDTAAISASDLLRDTDNTEQNPIVPNSTENSNISTSSNWKVSQFRDSIKYYYVTLPSGDEVTNFDIDGQTWNSNLNKNIVKVAFINGICGSNSTSSAAASFNATAHNITIDVYGRILGAGGRGGGTSGAPAISGENGGNALAMSSSGGNNVVVLVRSGSRIYGGGGGGEKGAPGDDGAKATCRKTTRVQSGCQQGNTASCPSGWNQYSSGNWCCEWRRGCNANIWWKECEKTYTTTKPLGGEGGNGGPGRGYNYQSGSLDGAEGGLGSCPSCDEGYSKTGGSCSTEGKTGGSGGDWATDGTGTSNSGSGGSAARAISGSNYSVTGTINSSTVKGAYNP